MHLGHGHRHPCILVGVVDGVLHEVDDRVHQLPAIPQHPGGRHGRADEAHPAALGRSPGPGDCLVDDLLHIHHLTVQHRVRGLEAGEFDDLADELPQPG